MFNHLLSLLERY